MKVIILETSGVLNDYNSLTEYVNHYFNYVNKSDCLRWYDESKFMLLSKICNELGAGVVLPSSWKFYFSDDFRFDNELTRIIKEFKKFNIPFLGFTPDMKDEDIKGRETIDECNIDEYLNNHNDIENFCLITTDNYDLDDFQDNRVITDFNEDGLGNGGLLPHHEKEIVKILSRKNK